MRYYYILLFAYVVNLSTSCKSHTVDPNKSIEVIDTFEDLQAIIDAHNDHLIILNFWATTCPPCIQEMPHFNALMNSVESNKMKILLISLDKAKDLDKRVYPFVTKHLIQPEVMILEDDNYSAWTGKIDESWYGALPATLLMKGDQKKFKFGMYESYEELKADVDEVSKG